MNPRRKKKVLVHVIPFAAEAEFFFLVQKTEVEDKGGLGSWPSGGARCLASALWLMLSRLSALLQMLPSPIHPSIKGHFFIQAPSHLPDPEKLLSLPAKSISISTYLWIEITFRVPSLCN